MASYITHLVIGEHVFVHLPQFAPQELGTFLLGCVLVDVHAFYNINRRTTHFAERFDSDGAHAYDQSCANFLAQLGNLLTRPWSELTNTERAFVFGYFCHLAADEDWKRFDQYTMRTLGIRWWIDLPVPVSVLLTAFDALSTELYINHAAVSAALSDASDPTCSRMCRTTCSQQCGVSPGNTVWTAAQQTRTLRCSRA